MDVIVVGECPYGNHLLNAMIIEQLGKMAHVMFGGLTHQPAIDLGKSCCKSCLPDWRRYFMPIAVVSRSKLPLKWHCNIKLPLSVRKVSQFASTHSGYYGDTWHAMSICDPINGMHSLVWQTITDAAFAAAPPLGFKRDIKRRRAALNGVFKRTAISWQVLLLSQLFRAQVACAL